MIESLLENLHRMAARLRPAALEHLGLIPALEQYIETFIHQSSISTQFEVVGLKDKRLSSATETALYRVAQEALTNVTRHAQASHVDVLLELRGSQVVLIVEDNGIGFDAETAAAEGRLGLVGMRERAQMLGGTWTIESTPGEGTTIAVEVPYDHSDFDR
jgi:signal transduction histidine kinase